MGRGKRDTAEFRGRITRNTIEELRAINPSLVTRDAASGELKFRHGAVGKYLERLILEDIERRKKLQNDSVLARFIHEAENLHTEQEERNISDTKAE